MQLCDEIGLVHAPLIWRGAPSIEAFDALLERRSVEGQAAGIDEDTNLMEGVVIRANPIAAHSSWEMAIASTNVPASKRFLANASARIGLDLVRFRILWRCT